MKLTPPQMRRAELQLKLGRTLGEISRSLGVPFELVCLALFGGGAGWVPPAAADTSLGAECGLAGDQPWASLDGADGQPDSLEGAEVSQRGSLLANAPDAPAIAEGDGPTAASASQSAVDADLEEQELFEIQTAIQTQHPASHATGELGDSPTRPGGDDGMVRGARTEAAAVTAGETAPSPGRTVRYRLHNLFGEYLHEHERGLTRVSKFFWRGTEADVVALWKRRPHFRDLEMEPITDTRVQP